MGILFNVLVVRPYYRWAERADARWRARKAAGENALPVKPSTAVLLAVGALPALALANAIIGSLF